MVLTDFLSTEIPLSRRDFTIGLGLALAGCGSESDPAPPPTPTDNPPELTDVSYISNDNFSQIDIAFSGSDDNGLGSLELAFDAALGANPLSWDISSLPNPVNDLTVSFMLPQDIKPGFYSGEVNLYDTANQVHENAVHAFTDKTILGYNHQTAMRKTLDDLVDTNLIQNTITKDQWNNTVNTLFGTNGNKDYINEVVNNTNAFESVKSIKVTGTTPDDLRLFAEYEVNADNEVIGRNAGETYFAEINLDGRYRKELFTNLVNPWIAEETVTKADWNSYNAKELFSTPTGSYLDVIVNNSAAYESLLSLKIAGTNPSEMRLIAEYEVTQDGQVEGVNSGETYLKDLPLDPSEEWELYNNFVKVAEDVDDGTANSEAKSAMKIALDANIDKFDASLDTKPPQNPYELPSDYYSVVREEICPGMGKYYHDAMMHMPGIPGNRASVDYIEQDCDGLVNDLRGRWEQSGLKGLFMTPTLTRYQILKDTFDFIESI